MIPCYFAMPVTYYDTPELEFDVWKLKDFGYDPYVPSSEEDSAGYKAKGMDYFMELLEKKNFNALVFRSFYDPHVGKYQIGAGVSKEAMKMLDMNKPVLELTHTIVTRTYVLQVTDPRAIKARTEDVEWTRARIKEIRENIRDVDGCGYLRSK